MMVMTKMTLDYIDVESDDDGGDANDDDSEVQQ